MSDKASTVKSLAELISSYSESYNQKQGLGASTEHESSAISAACRDLGALVTAPENWVNTVAGSYNNSAAICLALDLEIPRLLSQNRSASLDALIEATGAAPSLLRSVMTLCVENRILDEPSKETYALNGKSTCLLNENFRAWIHYLVDDGLKMGSYLSVYAQKNSFKIPDGKHKTAFEMAFQTSETFYEYYHSTDKERGRRFDSAMERYFHRSTQAPIEDIFNFDNLRPGATLVDVGGGRGHHSIRLAMQFPRISFTVQDFMCKKPTIIEEPAIAEAMSRVTWQQHDFFEKQPVRGASLYLLSHILMDHTDRFARGFVVFCTWNINMLTDLSECRKIIQHLAEAMTPSKSVLLVDDFLDPGKNGTLYSKANILNLHLIAAFGRPFRTMEEWEKLFSSCLVPLSIRQVSSLDNGRVVFQLQREVV
ncbi:S-adenosyl-L-methionine-dependent methyltransferase [Aspergillus uvarum CBS 121591]|uniref:S-adenosyl-L-methionine-dependent methyltransferase n=1 Tax=Aspergillus uvarum CBS 121591 TaxID=1448315 RepID=A0A319C5Q7_9EURO|nr:S-adenosyl-L-methionine-dependent methyltransferase [Aspergillus uvarum CBS 121591]PYH80494.1 S-adenosyl-L-methionine-dependent methyltransferase [Aspergillus uvarum CBS 121591]